MPRLEVPSKEAAQRDYPKEPVKPTGEYVCAIGKINQFVSTYEGKSQDKLAWPFRILSGAHEGGELVGFCSTKLGISPDGVKSTFRQWAEVVEGRELADGEVVDTDKYEGAIVTVSAERYINRKGDQANKVRGLLPYDGPPITVSAPVSTGNGVKHSANFAATQKAHQEKQLAIHAKEVELSQDLPFREPTPEELMGLSARRMAALAALEKLDWWDEADLQKHREQNIHSRTEVPKFGNLAPKSQLYEVEMLELWASGEVKPDAVF